MKGGQLRKKQEERERERAHALDEEKAAEGLYEVCAGMRW